MLAKLHTVSALTLALTLAFSGSALADLMTHVGWSSPTTAEYYL